MREFSMKNMILQRIFNDDDDDDDERQTQAET